jgi:hypothetical protein
MNEDQEREYTIPPIRLNFADFAVAGATFFKGISIAAANAWEVVEVTFMAHSRFIAEKQEFQRDAGRAIERLTTEVERDG